VHKVTYRSIRPTGADVKVLVYPHARETGGAQLNAIEIAAATRDRGHEVLVVSRDGPLADMARRLGLAHALLDQRGRHRPFPRAAAQLTQLARQHRVDVVHGYEWPPAVELCTGPRLRLRLPVVCTLNSMPVAPFLPRSVPLVVGTDESRLRAVQAGFGLVTLVQAPVDVRADTPEADPGAFRSGLGVDAFVPLVVAVGPPGPGPQAEGLLAACDAVGELASWGTSVQLAVVGSGPSRLLAERAADLANARAGRRVVVVAGPLDDLRPAYAAADVILGMGEQALRGLAFAKPLVVQGERGFWELLTPDTAPQLIRQGWCGRGIEADGRAAGTIRLTSILRELLDQPEARLRLGRYSRSLVVERYSLERAAAVQEEVYAEAIQPASRPSVFDLARDAARTGSGVLRHQVVRRWQRWRGITPFDDLNVTPGAWAGPAAASQSPGWPG
jgi:glycosyltransferase involved in cell wall biosynthesis